MRARILFLTLSAAYLFTGTSPALAEQPVDEALIIGIVDYALFTPLLKVRPGQFILFENALPGSDASRGAPNPQMEGAAVALMDGGKELKLGASETTKNPHGPYRQETLSYRVDDHSYGLAYAGELPGDMEAQASPVDYGKLLDYLLDTRPFKDDSDIEVSLYRLSLQVQAGILRVTDVDMDGNKEFWVTAVSLYGQNILWLVEVGADGASEIFAYCLACD